MRQCTRWLMLAGSLLMASGGHAAPVETPIPKIDCDQTMFDFVARDESETVTHVFTLKNAGGAPLEILSVKPDCGCTLATLSTNLLPPGGAAAVDVAFALHGRRGRQHKRIIIESNDPTNTLYGLYLQGTVTFKLGLDLDYLPFRTLGVNTATSRVINLTGSEKDIHPIVAAQSDSPYFSVSHTASNLTIETVPPLPQGQQARGTITVFTADTNRAPLKVIAFASVVGPVRVQPAEVIFMESEIGRTVFRSLLLFPGTENRYQVLGVKGPTPGTTATIRNLGPGAYRIDLSGITVTPDMAANDVLIETDIERTPTLRVPVKLLK
jgi:hypothetical protein